MPMNVMPSSLIHGCSYGSPVTIILRNPSRVCVRGKRLYLLGQNPIPFEANPYTFWVKTLYLLG